MKKKAYFYPITAYGCKSIPNPYLSNFISCLSDNIDFLNSNRPSKYGLFNIFIYLTRIDYIFFNWIEDLADRRGGLLQFLCLFFVILWCKIFKIKIVWTLHNKLSHYEVNMWLKRRTFVIMAKNSDFILTHSREGIKYYSSHHLDNTDKIRYFAHPLEKRFLKFEENPAIDILIWGSIIPYKGIDIFLRYLYEKRLETKYQVVIAGKVIPESYQEQILPYANENIMIENRYVPEDEIKKLICNSKMVIFTYEKASVLSSGILMDTLSYGGFVVAPYVGAFKDIKDDMDIIETYDNYDELLDMIDKSLNHRPNRQTEIAKFIEKNTWSEFGKNFYKWIK
jgi:glycosyltransferase involved in cell wall biosynthesis